MATYKHRQFNIRVSEWQHINIDSTISGSMNANKTGVDLRKKCKIFEQLAPRNIGPFRGPIFCPQENFSIIWAKSCNLRTSDPIFREKCCLEKSHFYTEQSFMLP